MATRDTGGQQRGDRRAAEADEETTDTTEAAEAAERAEAIGDDVDALLDEIDDVLEENAEEFVKSFVQKGGQ